jgi:hypothetical protein
LGVVKEAEGLPVYRFSEWLWDGVGERKIESEMQGLFAATNMNKMYSQEQDMHGIQQQLITHHIRICHKK